MDKTIQIKQAVNNIASKACSLASQIWEYAELNFREYKSADALCKAFEDEGFIVTRNICGMKTAFVAEYKIKSGSPVIAYLGEYDALCGLSQRAAKFEKEPIVEGEAGHGCGHNLLGAGSFAAAVALKNYLLENDKRGTVRFYGCPAEEDGGGKTHMAKAGIFDDVDAALTWHPNACSYVVGSGSLAVTGVLYSFKGVSAHAAANPYSGRSALDAAELMSVGCNYLREHIIPEARLHYAYRDVGGAAPNVVQASACVHYYIRAPHVSQMLEIKERVDNVARGAALMTGTELEIRVIDGVSDYVPNRALSELLDSCMKDVGAPEFDEADIILARNFANTITETERDANLARDYEATNLGRLQYKDKLLDDKVHELSFNPKYAEPGSTDVGDVSYTAPTAQCNYACVALGTGGHSWQMTAQCNSSIGMKGMLKAAEALCLAGARAIESPELLTKAKKELTEAVPSGYICPMPDGVFPEF